MARRRVLEVPTIAPSAAKRKSGFKLKTTSCAASRFVKAIKGKSAANVDGRSLAEC